MHVWWEWRFAMEGGEGGERGGEEGENSYAPISKVQRDSFIRTRFIIICE